jgi:RHS repeat-associated protein
VSLLHGASQTDVFNGLDTRVGSVTNSVPRTFLRDGAYVTDPVLTDGAASYTPGISERRGAATTFLHSGLKNADAQSGTAQTLSATRTYDAFGNVLSTSGSWQGPFGYQEDATGLRLLGHRLYDPSTGRFLTRDPIKDGRNWHAYCANDPIRMTDPSGLTSAAVVPRALPWAAGAALADGPFPVGDVIAVGILVVAAVIEIAEARSTPPFTGNPGDTVIGPRTSRRYGPDGYPAVDRDWDPTHDPPDHSHDWGRPIDGGPPTHDNRGAPRPPQPGDPPPPTNNPSSMAGIITSRGIIYQ